MNRNIFSDLTNSIALPKQNPSKPRPYHFSFLNSSLVFIERLFLEVKESSFETLKGHSQGKRVFPYRAKMRTKLKNK